MPAAIVTQGKTSIRDALKTLITHVGVSEDSTAFSAAHTTIDPAGDVAASRLIKASTEVDVDASTFDATMTITGSTEFTGKTIRTVSILGGATRADILTRTVRSGPIGVQAGDVFTIGVRVAVEDNS